MYNEISEGVRKIKTYKHLYEEMFDPLVVANCMLNAARRKLNRSTVEHFLLEFDSTYENIIKIMKDPSYIPNEKNIHHIIDGSHHKKRTIEKPPYFPEQIIHHLLMHGFKHIVINGLYEQTYGCIPQQTYLDENGEVIRVRKFGLLEASKTLKRWVQVGKKIYVCEADVHHAYDSVHIHTLVNMLQEVIKDDKWLNLMYKFLHYHPDDYDQRGLVLGHYTSPWLFNFYLKKFDHYMATQQEVKYLRFADNFYIVGCSKRRVQAAFKNARQYLEEQLKLELNNSSQVYRFEYKKFDPITNKEKYYGRAVNALGLVIHCNKVGLRKSILHKMRNKAIKIHYKHKITWHDGSSMFASLKWLNYADCDNYFMDYIYPHLKSRLSILQKLADKHTQKIMKIIERKRRKIYDHLENSKWIANR